MASFFTVKLSEAASAGTDGFFVVEGASASTGATASWATTEATTTTTVGSVTGTTYTGGSEAQYVTADVSNWVINTGAGADEIVVGSSNGSNTIDGGAGNDTIELNGSTGNVIILGSTSGADTIKGYTDNNTIYVEGYASMVGSSKTDGGMLITFDGGSVLLAGLTDANNVTIQAASTGDGGSTVELVTGTKVVAAEADVANTVYIGDGKTAGLDFAAVTDDLVVDLGDTSHFVGIVAATGSSNGDNAITGSGDVKNTLVGGAGVSNTLYGGAGTAADSIVGGSGAEDIFRWEAGNGKDTIANFTSGEDVLAIGTSTTLAGMKRDSKTGKITMTMGDGSKLIMDASTSALKVDDVITYTESDGSGAQKNAKFGLVDKVNNFTYDENVDVYYGGTAGDGVTVSETQNDVMICLDNSLIDTKKAYVGITKIDGSKIKGDAALGGAASSDTIIGGSGDSSLWGGIGGNDTLVGGSGENTFYFGTNSGKDVITKSNAGDIVVLNATLEDLNMNKTGLADGVLKIVLNDRSTLSINSFDAASSVHNFRLNDGNTYSFDGGSWERADS